MGLWDYYGIAMRCNFPDPVCIPPHGSLLITGKGSISASWPGRDGQGKKMPKKKKGCSQRQGRQTDTILFGFYFLNLLNSEWMDASVGKGLGDYRKGWV